MSGSDACKSIGLLLGAHLDGQLDAVKTLEVEDHLATCEVCRERLALDRALRGSLKKAVKKTAPDDVRARMLAAMAGESAREARREGDEAADGTLDASAEHARTSRPAARPTMLRSWRTMLPLASAAALVMGWGYASKQPVVKGMPDTVVAGIPGDDYLRDFVANHKRPVPPEQQDPKQIAQFDRYVGVPVRPIRAQNARLVGGRLLPLHGGERAAMLQYEVGQGPTVQRVTVFVYDPTKVQVGGAHLAPRAIGTAEVRVGNEGGYSVAVGQRRGVGIVAASDDPEASATLVAAADAE